MVLLVIFDNGILGSLVVSFSLEPCIYKKKSCFWILTTAIIAKRWVDVSITRSAVYDSQKSASQPQKLKKTVEPKVDEMSRQAHHLHTMQIKQIYECNLGILVLTLTYLFTC